MTKQILIQHFENLVKKKFNLYNSIFLNLPYTNVENIGMLIPILQQHAKTGLSQKQSPKQILDLFIEKQLGKIEEKDKIDFMFRVIQYVERQIVLYDSVEEAAYSGLVKLQNDLTIKDFFHLYDNKKDIKEIYSKLENFSARFVFTAHPTQFYAPSVLEIISKLRKYIHKNKINEIDVTLQQLGLTSLLNQNKPTPVDEAKNIIYYLKNVYYHTIGELYGKIKENVQNKNFNNTDIIKLGFWPGGDRDGNPFVTSETSLKVADELRLSLMKAYYSDVRELEQKLTFRQVDGLIKGLRQLLYGMMFDASITTNYKALLKPLLDAKSLLKEKYNNLFVGEVDSLIDKINIFKTHFATLDIRQDHSVHKKTVEAILIQNKFINEELSELNENELIDFLLNKTIKPDINALTDNLHKDTLRTMRVLKEIQRKNGEEGCNRYIISNSEDVFSVLFVFALFRWTGWETEEIRFDIVPLFETMKGMNNSESVMHKLFQIPVYRQHVLRRNETQTIMLGFSDGTKDGGYLQANWSIFRTKEKLTEVCNAYQIRSVFFDGRGGPPARGGGKTHRFYASLSNKISNNQIQLTIQGQTISSKYGTKEHFIHNSEQLLTAGLSNSFFKEQNQISQTHRNLIELLAEISFDKYNRLKQHPLFLPYLEEKSTLRYYSSAKIGSRPAKRGHSKKLRLSDLRAISYVGSWSQLKQNVPGYFGIGTALKNVADMGKIDELKGLYKKVPFFKALIQNSMMSLSKSYFELTAYMQNDKVYGEFWNILYEEYLLSKEMVLLISGYSELMESSPLSGESIKIREQLVLPLLIIQQYALQKTEDESSFHDLYEKLIIRSLYGNINAGRNSA